MRKAMAFSQNDLNDITCVVNFAIIILLMAISGLNAQSVERPRILKQGGEQILLNLSTAYQVFDHVSFCAAKNSGSKSNRKIHLNEPYKDKNPTVAFGLGLVPGFAIHGLGHFYIGKGKTGSLLLLIETISIVMSGASVDVNEDGRDTSNKFVGNYGLLLFMGSWVYDFVAAPVKAVKMNKEHKLKPTLSIEPYRSKTILRVSLAI
jgi:hypothetical protein